MRDQAHNLRILAGSRHDSCLPETKRPTEKRTAASKIVAVCSGKGGVGKTNVSLLIGIALSALGKRVLIFDADLGLANVHLLIGTAPRRNLSHVARGECAIQEVICDGPGGVGLVPGASGIEWMANPEPLKMGILARELNRLESAYDIIIIDTAAGIGPVTVEFASHADACIVVMTPEPTSLADAYATVKVLNEHGARHLMVLVNMAMTDLEGQEAFDRLSSLVVRFLRRSVQKLGILPYDAEMPRHIKAQRIILFEKPNRPLSMRISGIARNLCGLGMVPRGSFFSRLFTRKDAG